LDLPAFADYNDRRQLRAIALDVHKLEDRVKQLEQENDAMRADLLLWREDKWRE
jgi:outer membrane murein-binding lipoprotein Lpp